MLKLLSDEEIAQCIKKVYNTSYGRWCSVKKLYGHVKFPYKLFKKMQKQGNYNIIFAKHNTNIIGYAVYFRGYINEKKNIISWVLSLVVKKEYRQQRI